MAVWIVLVLSAGGAAWAAAGQPPSQRTWRRAPALAVNQSMNHRQVVAQDEAAGVAQLRGLAAEPTLEEIWAYVPAEGLWIELGCCERITEHGNYVGLETFVFGLFATYDDLVIYHIHPRSGFVRDNYDDAKRLLKTVEEGLPSAEDILAMTELEHRFRLAQPGGRIAWRIVSRHGVTEYGLSPKARSAGGDPEVRRFVYGVLEAEDLAESRALNRPTEPSGAVDDLIVLSSQRLSDEAVWVSFRPWSVATGR